MDKQFARMGYLDVEKITTPTGATFYMCDPYTNGHYGVTTPHDPVDVAGFADSSTEMSTPVAKKTKKPTAEPKPPVDSSPSAKCAFINYLLQMVEMELEKKDLKVLYDEFKRLCLDISRKQRRANRAVGSINGANCELCGFLAENTAAASNHINNMHGLPRYFNQNCPLLYRQKRKAMRANYPSKAQPIDFFKMKSKEEGWTEFFIFAREALRNKCYPSMAGHWPAAYKIY